MKKYVLIFIPLIAILIAGIFVFVFVHNTVDQNESIEYADMNPLYELVAAEPDDEFSKRIIDTAGDIFIYQGSHISDKMTQYIFFFRDWTEEDVRIFSSVIKENANTIEGKAQIIVFQKVGGLSIGAFTLDNTSDESLKYPDYDGFYRLRISDIMFEGESEYLLMISSIDGIRKLEATERFMKESEKNGIDWYEVWPELEEIVIIDGE